MKCFSARLHARNTVKSAHGRKNGVRITAILAVVSEGHNDGTASDYAAPAIFSELNQGTTTRSYDEIC